LDIHVHNEHIGGNLDECGEYSFDIVCRSDTLPDEEEEGYILDAEGYVVVEFV